MTVRHKILLPLFVLVMVGSLALSVTMSVLADTSYESYTSGDDIATEVYGDNWSAQTFTTTSSHTVSQVKIKAYRTLTPGTVTLSIRATDGSGHPTGYDLTSGTIDADAEFGTSSPGDWETISVTETSLEDATKYAIVVRAVGGDASNKIHWRANDAGSYSGGNREYATDGGATWNTDSSDDHMFEVLGNPALEIVDAKVFSSGIEDGDWYVVVHYKNIRPPEYPNEDPEGHFSIQFMDDTLVVAQVQMPSWGYKPAAIYINPVTASAMAWGDSDFKVRIYGNPDQFSPSPSAEHVLVPTDWVGSELFWLDEWVRDTADLMETYYGEDFIATELGGTTFPDGVLTYLGGQIFLDGMPGLENVRPNLFYVLVRSPEWEDSEYPHQYQESLDWETQLGTQTAEAIGGMADVFGINGRLFGGIGIFVLCVGMIGIFAASKASTFGTLGAILLIIPVFIMGAWLDLIPIALIAVLSTFAIFMLVWILWLRGT